MGHSLNLGDLHEHLAHTSWAGIDAEGLVDLPLARLGLGGLTYMQGAPIGTAEGRGDAQLSVK